MEHTQVDYVFELSKKQLISEVFRLRGELEVSKGALQQVGNLYHESTQRDQARLDDLLSKQTEIINQRLGLGEQGKVKEERTPRSLGRRSWSDTQVKYEAKKREEFWTKRIEEMEAQTKPETKEN